MKHTKIICTMGPNTNDKELLTKMASTYMDVARFNFSHGDYNEHKGRFELLKEVRKETGRPVAALLDTKGPEIRTGELLDHKKIMLCDGEELILTADECVGTKERVHINYKGLPEDVTAGNHILIDDGLIDLEVIKVEGNDIYTKILNGGELGEKKGVNVPNVKIKLPSLTPKDIEDIHFGIKNEFDIIAASFVRDAECIKQIRKILEDNGSDMLIIAKIENQEGLDNLDEIIEAADGIMVARGDMGVEISPEKLPHIQKMIIKKCNVAGKIVITATQMLDSMIRNPRPTRAEVTDVANAVYDGTDCVMLSGETAMGKYPFEALKMMAKVVEDTEKFIDYDAYRGRKVSNMHFSRVSEAVSHATISTAMRLNAGAVIAPTLTGITARMLSKWRPVMPVYALSPSMSTVRKSMILWGVTPIWSKRADSTDELIENSVDELKAAGLVESGEVVVVTAGVLTYRTRNSAAKDTNIMRVVTVN
ncbi:MAG: pyruvate kinase [Eubacteriales bacterium]|nr:pyruvate kinase [Eubacteriales bacterium]